MRKTRKFARGLRSKVADKEVETVACRWRIRHKLILAHGLVVAIVFLLLCGTLYGLVSFRTTTRTFGKKLVELKLAEDFRGKVKVLADNTGPDEIKTLSDRIKDARAALEAYDEKLKEYSDRGQEIPYFEEGTETGWVKDLHKFFDELEINMHNAAHPAVGDSTESVSVVRDPAYKKTAEKIHIVSDDLVNAITTDLNKRVLNGANEDYKITLWFVLGITGISLLAMVGSLRFFYRWMFYPIRDLQLGVEKVAKGDFKHQILIQSSDEIQTLAGAFNDMTRRLDDMYSDLARQVNERSRQLVRSERLANVGFLAAGVAHEINNPLASIAFCSEALERRVRDMLAQIPASSTAAEESQVITKYLKMIQQESFRCKEITSRLLEFSRGGEKRREPTDLGELVDNVLDMVQHLEVRAGKNLLFNPEQEIVALVNAHEIKSVVVNLVVNALESLEAGGTLSIKLGLSEGLAELVFEDTGCGMTPEVLDNIFEPFFTRSRGGKGTGLGLSICHRIISQHQGEIEARSAGANKGSTFVVRLPLVPAEEGKIAHLHREDEEGWSEPARPRPARKAA